jgi:hypothetical protein
MKRAPFSVESKLFIFKTFQKIEDDKSADSTPTILACAYHLGRHDTSSCRAGPSTIVPCARGSASDAGEP